MLTTSLPLPNQYQTTHTHIYTQRKQQHIDVHWILSIGKQSLSLHRRFYRRARVYGCGYHLTDACDCVCECVGVCVSVWVFV